eukprot:TRINITY_DN18808_c0_g1_i1.p1 TRINITY_DN18808_c0_g1~~TRINITY_DN18808_c0_g1_i1.p1  ORF type:complete len:4341 (-),score=787.41 TRINITY_DN18808_c0_g1_i1:161-11695(-)
MVVEHDTPVDVSYMLAGTGALGGSACGRRAPDEPLELNLTLTTSLTFRDCRLRGGTTFNAYLYAADEKGATDGVLTTAVPVFVPFSNTLTADPDIKSISGGAINVTLNTSLASGGLASLAVWPSDTEVDAVLAQSGTGANCIASHMPIEALEDAPFGVGGCTLLGGNDYILSVYVADNQRYHDGQLLSMNISVPFSNTYVVSPSISGTTTATEARMEFETSSEGMGFLKVMRYTAPLFTDVVSLMAHTGPDLLCETGPTSLRAGVNVLVVSGCTLTHSFTYRIYAYAAGLDMFSDGALAGPFELLVSPGHSNAFTMVPALTMPAAFTGISVSFSLRIAGRAWVLAVPGNEADSVDVARMVASQTSCAIQAAPVVAGQNVLTIAGCEFEAGKNFAAFVYVTNEGGGDDGVLSLSVPVVTAPSNDFGTLPALMAVPTPTTVKVSFVPKFDGYAIVKVLTAANASMANSVSGFLTDNIDVCMLDQSNVTAQVTNSLTISGCSLEPMSPYILVVYIASGNVAANDGLLSQHVGVMVPTSNAFVTAPSLVGTPSSEGVVVTFHAAASLGKAWISIVSEAAVAQTTIQHMKENDQVGTIALGDAGCKFSGAAVVRGIFSERLGGCNLFRGGKYAVFVYITDNAGGNDGILSDPVHFTVPESNTFALFPSLMASPTTDGVSYRFQANAALGRAWSQIVQQSDAAALTATVLKAGTAAVGGVACRHTGVAIGDVALYWHLTGCILAAGSDYSLAVYVEDDGGNDDGALFLLPIKAALNPSNYFTELPIIENPSSDTLDVLYTAYESVGVAWLSIVEADGTLLSITDIRRGARSVGASTCKRAEEQINNMRKRVVLTECGLAQGQTYRVAVYVSGPLSDNGGTFAVADLKVPVLDPAFADPLVRSFADLGVTRGAAHTYQVRAVNRVGAGPASPAAVNVLVANAPASPGLPLVASRTLTSMNLQWVEPSTLGADIERYRLFMKGPGEGDVFEEVYSGPDTAFTKASLMTGAAYQFRVSAVNAAGEGPPSAVREMAACIDPTAPGAIRVKSRSRYHITIEWSPPFSDGGCPVLAYMLMQDGEEVSRQQHTEYSLPSVVPAQAYEFKVRCETSVAVSEYGAVANIVAAEAPSKVSALNIVSQSSSGISLSWTGVPSALDGGAKLTGYRVYISDLASTQREAENVPYVPWGTTNSLTTSVMVSPLTPGGQYCFKVAGINFVTETSALEDQQPRTSDGVCGYAAGVPAPPPGIYFTRQVKGEITVRWPPSGDDGGAPIELYELLMNQNRAGYEWVATNAANDLDHTVYGCTEGEKILFKIRARNSVGWGPYSAEVEAACATPPAQMQPPHRTESTRSSITLGWNAPNNNGAMITGYRVYQATGAGPLHRVYEGMGPTFKSGGLATGTMYRYTVTALNEAGESVHSEEATMLAAQPPGKPVSVKFTADSRSDTIVSWTPPADNGGQDILRYEVWYKEGLDAGPIDKLAWSGGGQYSDVLTFTTGLSYQFQVAAVNAVTEHHYLPGTRSDIVYWHAGVLSQPPDVTLAASTLISVGLAWEDPSDTGGLPVTGYTVHMDDALGGPLELQYSGTAKSFSRVGLATGYTYRFEIRVITTKGPGLPYEFNVIPCNVPGAVENARVLEQTTDVIRIGWNPPTDTGECPILGYTIYAGTATNAMAKAGTTPSVMDTIFELVPGASGVDYYIQVYADNWKTQASSAFKSDPSPLMHTVSAAAPSLPRNVARTGGSLTSVTLSWDPPVDDGGAPIQQYYVRRNDGLGGTDFMDATGGWDTPTSTTYTVTALTASYYYTFQVAGVSRAVSVGAAEPNYFTLNLYAAAVPTAPAAPTVVPGSRTSNGMTLSWDPPTDSGGIAVLGYRVYRDNGAGDAIDVMLWNGDGLPNIRTFAVSGLTGGLPYRFTVTALNAAGESLPSTILDAPGGAFAAPMEMLQRDPAITPLSTAVSLKWAAPVNNGGSPVLEYVLRYDNGDYSDFTNERVFDRLTFTDTISSLPEGKFIRFVIHSRNAVGLSEPSPVYRTQVCANPDPVVTFAASDHTDSEVKLSWSPPANVGCNNALVTGYKVMMRQGGNAYSLVHEAGPAVLSFVQRGISAGQIYVFKIFICTALSCDIGYPANGLTVLAGSTPIFEEDAITLLGATATTLNVQWTQPPGLPILETELYIDNGNFGEINNLIYAGTAMSFMKDTLNPGVTYSFQVRGRNANGWGSRSGIVSFVTSVPPNAPENVRYLSSTVQTLEIAWDEPSPAQPNEGRVVKYEVHWSDQTSASAVDTLVTSPAFRSASPVVPLTVGSTYRFQVRACNLNGCGPLSTALDLVCGAFPEAPSAPFVLASSTTEITVGWTYVGKDNGGVALEKFNIKVSVDGGNTFVAAGSTSDASVHRFTYSCGTQQTYYFQVAADNGVGGPAGEGPPSPAVGIFCAPPPLTPANPLISTTASTLTVQLLEPTPVQLSTAVHTGWRILVDDTMNADDLYEETAVYDTTKKEHTFTSGIITGHSYRVKLRLCSVVGCSPESQVSGPTVAASPAGPPAPVYVVSSTDATINIAWRFTGSNGGAPIWGWRIFISTDGENWPPTQVVAIDDVNQMSYTVSCTTYGRELEYVWIRVAGYSVAGVGTQSVTLPARCSAPPDVPAAPTVISSSNAHITVGWTSPTVAALHNALHAGTKVQFDDGAGGPFTAVTLTDTLQVQYTKTGVAAGQTYRFKIQTLSQTGESAPSAVLSAVAATTSDAPEVTVTSTSNTGISYSAKVTTSNGGSPLTGFHFFASTDGITYPTTPTAVLSPSFVTHTLDCTSFNGVNRAQQYFWVRIAAVTAAGVGALSVPAKTRCSAPPDQPVAPGLVSSTPNSVTISFAPSTLHSAYLTGFKVYTDDGNSGPWSVDTITDSTQRTFTKYGLAPGLPYKFKFQVISETGLSALSPPSTFYSASTPDGPTLYVHSSTNSEIHLAWKPNYDGGSPVSSWRVYGSLDGENWPAVGDPQYTVMDGATLTQELNCLDQPKWGGQNVQKQYVYLRVSGVNAAGIGVPSNSLRWRCSAPPAAPARPVRVRGTTSSITISYVPTDMQGAVHTGYKILYDDGMNGVDLTEVVITATSQTEYTIAGLTADLSYRIYVKMLSETGESDPSDVLFQTCGADPDPPSAPYFTSSRNNNELTIGWDFPGSNGGSVIQGWNVYLSNAFAESSWNAINAPNILSTTMSATIDCRAVGVYGDLSQKFIYIKVAAVSAASVGQLSPVSKIFCANRPDPPVLSDLTGTETSVTVQWVEGNLYGAGIRHYKIYVNDGLGGDLTLRGVQEDTSQRTYTVSGLQPDRGYQVQVTVVSGAAESLPSNTITVRSCGFPAVPAAPIRGSSTADSITLAWSAPADNGCPMTGYRLYIDDGAVAEIYPGAGDENDPTDASLNPAQLQFTKTGLITGNTYGFRLRAYNTRGPTWSAWTYIKAASEPNIMNLPRQEPLAGSATTIALAWDVPPLNGGMAIGFKVFRNTGVGTPILSVHDPTCGMEQSPAPQKCVITGLSPGEIYQVRMTAINEIGESGLSPIAELTAASVPATIHVTNVASSLAPMLKFDWDPPSSQGAFVYNYEGELVRVDNGGPTITWDGGGTPVSPFTTTEVTLTADLVRQVQYKFRVRGRNKMGGGVWSEWSSLVDSPRGFTLDDPITPTNFGRHSDPAVIGAVKLGWDALDNEAKTGGDDVAFVKYEVYGGPDVNNMVQLTMTDDSNTYHEQAVPAYTSWYFKMRALNRGGKPSPFTAVKKFTSAEVPAAPASLSLTSTTPGEVNMIWTVPLSNGGATIERYEVTFNGFTLSVQVLNTQTTYTFLGQAQGALLTYSVRAVNSVGAGPAISQDIVVLAR